MQQMWSDIDHYIESHLIPEDPILTQTLENTAAHDFDHLGRCCKSRYAVTNVDPNE